MNKQVFFIIFILFLHVIYPQSGKYNVVFIMCDDLNDYQGVFGGHPQAKTPNIDKLSENGVRFVNAQSNVPVCQPSRNSLFTGVYPHRSKDFKWTSKEKQSVLMHNKTIMQFFQENGYITLGTGKLMHGNSKQGWDKWGEPLTQNYGPFYFDGNKVMPNPSTPEPFSTIGPIDGSFGRLSSSGPCYGIKNEKGWIYGWNKKPLRYVNEDDRDLLPDELHAKWVEDQIKSLDAKDDKQPFFIGVGFVRPHTPMNAPDKYFDMFPLDSIKLADWIPEDTNDVFYKENFGQKVKGYKYYNMLLQSYNNNREKAIRSFLQAYLACVAFVDEQIGRVVAAVENSSFSKNTIIVFTSDHGWQMGEKNYLFKNSPWEESARIPMIWKVPGIKKSISVDQPVSLIDIFPTLIDICNLKGNYKFNVNGGNMGGYSMRPLIFDEGKWEGPNGALTLVGNNGYGKSADQQTYSYRTRKYRYIKYGNGKKELYNHKIDPFEWNNIIDEKKYDDETKGLENEMNNILTQR